MLRKTWVSAVLVGPTPHNWLEGAQLQAPQHKVSPCSVSEGDGGLIWFCKRLADVWQVLRSGPPCQLISAAHHHGVGVGPGGRPQDVVRVLAVGHPVADGLRCSVLQGGCPTVYGAHFGTQQAHAEHVELLPLHVLCQGQANFGMSYTTGTEKHSVGAVRCVSVVASAI